MPNLDIFNLKDLVAIFVALFVLAWAKVCLRILPNSWLIKQIDFQAKVEPKVEFEASEHAPTQVQSNWLAWHDAIRMADRLQFGENNCLARSIALAWILRWRHVDARVCLGANKQGINLASHAWVEVDGILIGEPRSVALEFYKLWAPKKRS